MTIQAVLAGRVFRQTPVLVSLSTAVPHLAPEDFPAPRSDGQEWASGFGVTVSRLRYPPSGSFGEAGGFPFPAGLGKVGMQKEQQGARQNRAEGSSLRVPREAVLTPSYPSKGTNSLIFRGEIPAEPCWTWSNYIWGYNRFRGFRNKIHYLQLTVFIIQAILSMLKEYLMASVLNPFFMNSQIILISFFLLSTSLKAVLRKSLLSSCQKWDFYFFFTAQKHDKIKMNK